MEFLILILYIILSYYALAILLVVIPNKFGATARQRELSTKKLMIVFGSGGHTTEMLLMLKKFDFQSYKHVYFVLGHSDTWSATKIHDYFLKSRNVKLENIANLTVLRLYRSREVKQSYVTSVFTTLMGLVHSLSLIAKIRPDIVITNGPGTAVPLTYALFGFSKVLLWNTKAKILFIESFCRVTSLSLSGKLLYPIADKFVVHWPELKDKCPKAILYKDKII